MTNRSKEVIFQVINEKHQAETHIQELEGRFKKFEGHNDELLGIYEEEANICMDFIDLFC